jgi:hypothetical protein
MATLLPTAFEARPGHRRWALDKLGCHVLSCDKPKGATPAIWMLTCYEEALKVLCPEEEGLAAAWLVSHEEVRIILTYWAARRTGIAVDVSSVLLDQILTEAIEKLEARREALRAAKQPHLKLVPPEREP